MITAAPRRPFKTKLTDNLMMRALEVRSKEMVAALPPCCSHRGFTYLIGGAGLVKIGQTTDLAQRALTLQVSSPTVLSIVAVARSIDLERRLHARFSDVRAHGEWFDEALVMAGLRVEIARSRTLNECLCCSIALGPIHSFRRMQEAALAKMETKEARICPACAGPIGMSQDAAMVHGEMWHQRCRPGWSDGLRVSPKLAAMHAEELRLAAMETP